MTAYCDLTGKVALVTGGSRGIGAAIVGALAQGGAQVAFTYKERADAADRVQAVAPDRIRAIRADTSVPQEARRAVHAAREHFGGLDVVVANAGITKDTISWKLSIDDFEAVVRTNLLGAFATVQAAIPHLRDQQWGRLVLVGSINGLRGKAGQAAYSASKGGLVALTKTLAKELGRRNITVNCVAPGFIDTDLTAGVPQEIRDKAVAETALGRVGAPEDVAAAVRFLCSEQARHITGQVLCVDGGQYM